MDKTRNRASGAAVWISLCLVTSGEAHAQIAPPECEECEPFEARYRTRAIARIARRLDDPLTLMDRLWYLNSLHDGLGVLSWNSRGEIVGTRFRAAVGPVSEIPRGFIWLPQPAYGLAAGAPHDIFNFAHPGEFGSFSYAWDISDEGLIVGAAGANAEKPGGSARAWDLAALSAGGASAPPFEINFGVGSQSGWTMALAITPHSTLTQLPIIVGLGQGCCEYWREPYEFLPVNTMFPHVEPPNSRLLPERNVSQREWACDIAQHCVLPIGSYDQPFEFSGFCPGEPGPTLDQCKTPKCAGAHFPNASSTDFYRYDSSVTDPDPVDQVTGLRSSSLVTPEVAGLPPVLAGYAIVADPGHGPCEQHAALWTQGLTADARNILQSSNSVVSIQNPIAQRWRSIDCICPGEVVLGWSAVLESPSGYLWTTSRSPTSDDFELHEVEELFDGLPSGVHVQQVYDILPTGEILVLVRKDLNASPNVDYDLFAAVLVLAGDLNGDRLVGGADLAMLIGNWGATLNGDESALNCDLDLDLSIDGADLSLFLSTPWRSAPTRLLLPADLLQDKAYGMLLPEESCEGLNPLFRSDTVEIEQCFCCAIGAFGFQSAEEFAQWARTAGETAVEGTCICVKGLMHNMMEVEHD